MNRRQYSLAKTLRGRLTAAHVDWHALSAESEQIIVFGSRALGVNKASSDLDVLIVGNTTKRIKRSGLDMVCISPLDVASEIWLKSELAVHVSQYGVWITGNGEWRFHASIGQPALHRKERRLVSLIRNVSRSWERLHPTFRSAYSRTIRRELQRLSLLRNKTPIPPTPILDCGWHDGEWNALDLINVADTIHSVGRTDFLAGTILNLGRSRHSI